MKYISQNIRKQLTQFSLFATMSIIMFAMPMVADAALQGQAGNTIIKNTVSVAYNDVTNAPQTAVTASVTVTVTTVDSAAQIVAISPGAGISTGSTADTYTYAVTVRTTANGPGTTTLAATDTTGGANLTVSATGPAFAPGSLFLGSTTFDPTDLNLAVATTVANLATITIAVPNDGGVPTDAAATGGATGDNVINALAVGDTVYITDGTTYFGPFDVTTVTDPAVGAGATAAPGSLVLTNNTGAPIAFTPAAGWMIVESQTTNMTVTQGALTDPAIPTPWTTTISTTMGGAGPVISGTTVVTTATQSSLGVAKYVRNVTAPIVGAGALAMTINGGNTYYASGVSGKPNDILEYALVITNNGTGLAKAVVATDNIPVYTTLDSGATYAAGGGVGAGTEIFAIAQDTSVALPTDVPLTIAVDTENGVIASGDAAGIAAGSTMSIFIGDTNAGATLVGGNVAAGAKYTVIYRVKVQ